MGGCDAHCNEPQDKQKSNTAEAGGFRERRRSEGGAKKVNGFIPAFDLTGLKSHSTKSFFYFKG